MRATGMEDQKIRNKMVFRLLRDNVSGSHKVSVDTLVNNALPSHAQGRGKQLISEMASDPAVPVEKYGGGHRENVRLSDVQAAADYLEDNDGDVPFGWD